MSNFTELSRSCHTHCRLFGLILKDFEFRAFGTYLADSRQESYYGSFGRSRLNDPIVYWGGKLVRNAQKAVLV